MITCGSRATRAANAPAMTEKPSSVTDMIQRAPVRRLQRATRTPATSASTKSIAATTTRPARQRAPQPGHFET